ncbi:hypothetical protein HOE67_00870 [Candidatus Peregrinibacteria bacterium]|nr:hypothetical protein [Candidatus Peregrinibacteria bacterium]MBT4055640.1 hypothetical protein [Candidatus Peregrinibacteria bacterium]
MQGIEKQYIQDMFTKEREYLMYEVFIEKGLDVFMKKASFDREHRPLIKHFAF